MLNLSYISYRFYPARSGSEVLVAGLARAMRNEGAQVEIVASDLLDWFGRRRQRVPGLSDEYSVRLVPFSTMPWPVAWARAGIGRVTAPSVLNWAISQDPAGKALEAAAVHARGDILHATPIPRSCVGAAIRGARRSGKRVVITPAYHPEMGDDKMARKWVAVLSESNEVWVSTRAERDFWHSKGLHEELLHVGGIGIDLPEYTPREPSGRFTVGFLSRSFGTNKGAPAVVGAARELPNVEFILAGGDSRERSRLERATGGFPANIRYAGDLTEAEKDAFLRRIDLLAAPSRADSFGFSLMEALARGTPVVAADIAALRDVYAGVSPLIPFGNSHALSEVIDVLGSNAAEWRRRSIDGRALAERYSWKSVGIWAKRRYEALLNSC